MTDAPTDAAPTDTAQTDTAQTDTAPTSVDSPFLTVLVRLLRAEDSHGAWERRSDAELLSDYIVTREDRRLIPLIGDPDPDTLWRVEKFYGAVGLRIEQLTGQVASPMMKMHHEGFGRVVLLAGRLVVLSRHLRDVHRYGHDSLAKLEEAGETAAQEAATLIRRFPEVADA